MIFFQKKVRKNLQVPKNVSTFASQLRNKPLTSRLNNGIWCNGNTADSGPAFPGSSPGIPTKRERNLRVALFLFEEIKRDVLPKIPYITLKNIFI